MRPCAGDAVHSIEELFVSHFQDLSNKVEQIQHRLATQITTDFHNTLMNSMPAPKAHALVSDKLTLPQLADACAVVSVLEDQKVKAELLKWFICKYDLDGDRQFDGNLTFFSIDSHSTARI